GGGSRTPPTAPERPPHHRRGYRPTRIRGRERAAAPALPPDAAGCLHRTQSERPSARHLLGAVVPAPVRRRCDRADSAAGQSTQKIVEGPDESGQNPSRGGELVPRVGEGGTDGCAR